MNISNKTLRNLLRIIHLVIGGLVIAYIYLPLGNVAWFSSLVRVSIPILTITGLSMWQMPLITKTFKRQTAVIQS